MEASRCRIYTTMSLMVMFGGGCIVVIKLLNSSLSEGEYFHHPFFLTLLLFIGEMCSFIVVWVKDWIDKRKYPLSRSSSESGAHESSENNPEALLIREKRLRTDYNPLVLAIPMLCDVTATILMIVSYINVQASVAQMIGSSIIFVVAIEAVFFLGKKLYRHHYLGATLVVIGLLLVALSAFLHESETVDGNTPLAIITAFLSSIMQGNQFITEEKLLRTYHLRSFEVVAWEGLWGCILLVLILPALQYIPCSNSICNHGVVEDSLFALKQIFSEPRMIILCILVFFFICIYNGFGLAVTKMISSTNRVVVRQMKIVLIWIFFLVYPYEGGESFKPLQLIGFIVLVIGVFLYNEVIVIHHLGFADHLDIRKDQEDNHSNEYVEFARNNSNSQ
ncbi:unnamed protein product [Moneuplotes crassus]|uniref:Sugar phosphate transporter domain-containing protein n=1 Tax=Euplotes crassus TaxID=5936 RepID=A0AAD1XHT9_EUPCR|nr:unnamed protein product [Moneuplotes crassus]